MKIKLMIICLLSLFTIHLWGEGFPSIVPYPRHIVQKKGKFILDKTTHVYSTQTALPTAELWAKQIRRSTGFHLPVVVISSPKKQDKGIYFILPKPKTLESSEDYTLQVEANRIIISAKGTAGLFYGSQTLNQLLPSRLMDDKTNMETSVNIPIVDIQDSPRFGWRGYMLDVSRTFYSIDFLKKYIDVMSLYKLNTLHLHLTDDQGWRIEIKKYPELTASKATTYPSEFKQPAERSGYYTQEELKDLVHYAAKRHIQIIPEIDVPGHTWPVLITYPELAVTDMLRPDYIMPFRDSYHFWGNQFTPNSLDPVNEKVYTFLDDVFTELAAIFPSPYIHFGGDEVRHYVWEQESHIQQFMKEHQMERIEEIQSYFVRRISEIIRSKGKQPLGWNDILKDAKNLPRNTTIMSWLGSTSVKEAAKYDFSTIAVPCDYLYLDIRQGSSDDGVFADLSYPFAITPEMIYGYDPAEGLNKKEQKCLMGVQANLWTHMAQEIKDVNIQTFPRLLALAEMAWVMPEGKDYISFKGRMENQYPRLSALKIDYFKSNGHIIAQWTPQDISREYRILEWDVTEKVYASGRVMAGLFYTKGNFLNINSMQLLEDGVVISEDYHRGFADDTRETGKKKIYLYDLEVKQYQPEKRYKLCAEVSGYQGTESYGNVVFNLTPYKPFTVVESK